MACSLGIAAAAGADFAAHIAPAAERAGFAALWVNDTPGHDALDVLAAAARSTSRLGLATGVLPVDRRSAAEVAARIRSTGLDAARLTLGVGSGGLRLGALSAVERTVGELRSLTTARIVVGALGPRMRRLGATAADGVLLSWLPPDAAERQTREAHDANPRAHAAIYVRTALDEDAVPVLRRESDAYAGYPAYAANFTRLGITPADTVLLPGTFASGLRAYLGAADEVVLRMILPDARDIAAAERFVGAAAAALS
jgi:alkanesulfonate monooxygenase SsuD/methylene tetrahydromethanopterin reductase-like flavin-dependent oxidoreductase (luciferase family)